MVVRRIKNRQSPFAPDRSHLHHMIIDTGISSKNALIFILSGAAIISTIGIVLSYVVSPLFSLLVFASSVSILSIGVLLPAIERKFLIK